MVAALLLLSLNTIPPVWLDLKISGYENIVRSDSLRWGNGLAIYDRASHYFLLQEWSEEEFNAELMLTKDRNCVRDRGIKPPWERGPSETSRNKAVYGHITLRTGKGIKIGDSPERVRKVLGTPMGVSGTRVGLDFVYGWDDRKDGWAYVQTYRFTDRKLTEIEFDKEYDHR